VLCHPLLHADKKLSNFLLYVDSRQGHNEVLRLIARLGGFLGRKGDGEPGAKAIWLGLKEVHVAAKTLQKLRAGGHADNCV
ncbi:IS4 family transposase, partial [Burkholderia ubonensis]|uniref:IS4 family transposase n=1 Tax=Burkholderia ubonensis TaxID=101571 RepID=UPI0022B76AAD